MSHIEPTPIGTGSFLDRIWDKLIFFAHFVKNPHALGMPFQSSREVAAAVRDAVGSHGARRVVELGAGMGRLTESILEVLPQDETLLCVEREGVFCGRLRSRFGRRVHVVHDDARGLRGILENTGWAEPDAIVCSIPLRNRGASNLCMAIAEQLPSESLYVQVSLSKAPIEVYFDVWKTRRVLRGIIPARVHLAVPK